MFALDQYQLVDFGHGRKLERFGRSMVDRPSPAADPYSPTKPDAWDAVAARFEVSQSSSGPERGSWQWPGGKDLTRESQLIRHDRVKFELGWTPFGHVGLFPEQAANWDWIARSVTAAERPLSVLNLFAYTGGSTLAAAAEGAEVTHVDASRTSVDWARRNAAHSNLAEAPIRWIVEDAAKYATRELRRGRRYDGIILDPPSYGHGPKGELWKVDQHLPELLATCAELLSEHPAFLLLTCHSPMWDTNQMQQALVDALSTRSESLPDMQFSSGPMAIAASDQRMLHCGDFVRVDWAA